MVTLAEVFRQHGPTYRTTHRETLLPSHLRVMWSIEHCRTETLGGHIYECSQCGETVYNYHSCQNRHCNLCQSHKAEEWLEKTTAMMQLPTPYYLVTFTLPAELRTICYKNQCAMYNLLFRCAANALQELACDPRFVGGQIGIIGVLHTWTRDLRYHPHVHFLVPAGGLDFSRELWHRARNHMLVHVKPLMLIFRAKMRDAMKKLGFYQQVNEVAWTKPWSVHSKSVGYGEKAFAYVADYLFRVGISNQRIIQCEDGEVSFRYKDAQTKRQVTCKLAVGEFIERFLMHVLPKGFVKVRYYGFYAPSARTKLAVIRELLAADEKAKNSTKCEQSGPAIEGTSLLVEAESTGPRCPTCKQPMLLTGAIAKRGRHPPG